MTALVPTGVASDEARTGFSTPWTPAKVSDLKRLYGTMPTRALAELIGISRNAVIGKAYRLGLSTPKPKEVQRMPTPETKTPMDRKCTYIAKDLRDPTWRYCHKPALPGQSWCAACRAIVWRPKEPERPKPEMALVRQRRAA